MTKSKVPSFTLSELLVVMVITLIVVGIAFSVVSLVKKQADAIGKGMDHTSQLALFQERLWYDFRRYREVSTDGSVIWFKNQTDSLYYQAESNYWIMGPDTMEASFENLKFFRDGIEVEQGEIDALRVEVNKGTIQIPVFVFKKKDAASYMKSWD